MPLAVGPSRFSASCPHPAECIRLFDGRRSRVAPSGCLCVVARPPCLCNLVSASSMAQPLSAVAAGSLRAARVPVLSIDAPTCPLHVPVTWARRCGSRRQLCAPMRQSNQICSAFFWRLYGDVGALLSPKYSQTPRGSVVELRRATTQPATKRCNRLAAHYKPRIL